MFSIYENNKKMSGACRSFVLCLDYLAISPFIYFKYIPEAIGKLNLVALPSGRRAFLPPQPEIGRFR